MPEPPSLNSHQQRQDNKLITKPRRPKRQRGDNYNLIPLTRGLCICVKTLLLALLHILFIFFFVQLSWPRSVMMTSYHQNQKGTKQQVIHPYCCVWSCCVTAKYITRWCPAHFVPNVLLLTGYKSLSWYQLSNVAVFDRCRCVWYSFIGFFKQSILYYSISFILMPYRKKHLVMLVLQLLQGNRKPKRHRLSLSSRRVSAHCCSYKLLQFLERVHYFMALYWRHHTSRKGNSTSFCFSYIIRWHHLEELLRRLSLSTAKKHEVKNSSRSRLFITGKAEENQWHIKRAEHVWNCPLKLGSTS